MGLAASQARLLFLTSRKSDVEYGEMQVANEKISLSRQSEKISDEYANSLNAKKIEWVTDGDNEVDLTYNLLMRPNNQEADHQYIYTDSSTGRVVLDDAYANILGGGNSGSGINISRNDFLAAFGIDGTLYADTYAGTAGYVPPTPSPVNSGDIDPLTQKWQSLAKTQAIISSGATTVTSKDSARAVYQELSGLMSQLTQIGSELRTAASTEPDATKKAKYLKEAENIDKLNSVLQKLNRDYIEKEDWTGADKDRMQGVITGVFGTSGDKNYAALAKGWDGSDNIGVTFADIQNGINFKSVMSELQTNYGSVSPTNPSPVETPDTFKANFYTNLYYAIKSQGWVRSSNVQDKSYLQNQLLRGNIIIEELQNDCSWKPLSDSDSDSPMRIEKDTDAITKAEAKYNIDTKKVNIKEEQLDLQLKNLDTERSALDTEIDSVKSIISKNIERSFKMFQA